MTKILYAGRVSPIKDIPTLRRAASILGKKVKLEIISNFPYSQNVHIYRSADIIVVPTLSKALDKIFLEGLAFGIPTVGTNTGYPFMRSKFPELIFKAGDASDLAAKLEWLIENPMKAKKITTEAREYVKKNFDLEKLMDKIVGQFNG